MNKLRLALFAFVLPVCCFSQNYQCVQPGVIHYFINDGSYLRGIRIDSTKSVGGVTNLYPYKSPRGYYYNNQKLKPGGSWLGSKITMNADGTTYFDNYWGDTVVIKTQANVSDTWIFYNDTTSTYYTATVTKIDTMTVLGGIDSVKTITLTARNASGIVTSDNLNNTQIVVSKKNGFVKTMDLFMFPLHEPKKPCQPGFDLFTDYYFGNCGNFIFTLVNLYNPTWKEIYHFNIGDIYETEALDNTSFGNNNVSVTKLNTVVDKIAITPFQTNYTLSVWTHYKFLSSGPPEWTGGSLVQNSSDTSHLLAENLMPEEWGQKTLLYYYPNDSSSCIRSAAYKLGNFAINDSVVNTFEPCGAYKKYKIDVGMIYEEKCTPNPPVMDTEKIVYIKRDGIDCGMYKPLDIPQKSRIKQFFVYPNPASEILHIHATAQNMLTILLISPVGQVLRQMESSAQNVDFDVTDIPTGTYILNVSDKTGNNEIQKISVIH